MAFADEVRAAAEKWVLANAVQYGGTPNTKAVLGKLMAERPDWRPRAKELQAALATLGAEIEAVGLEAQKARLAQLAPELLERRRSEAEQKVLPPLPGAVDGKVVMRLAPYPSGPLHIGNARMAVLNDEYAKRHRGRLLLVFDDTIGSEEKVTMPEAFDLIPEGLEWLGVTLERPFIYKSDRIPVFYEWAARLIKAGHAYVCECPAETLRANREQGVACAHRGQSVDEALAGWERMLDGSFPEGSAVLRLKTDIAHPDPAFRDRVLMRIAERPHPRVGTRYRVWPMLEFSWAVDDHLLGITHVLRGKDLVIEDLMEQDIWGKLGLPKAYFGHFGMLRVAEAKISKSKSLAEVRGGHYTGWDDPRTWSLQSLARRGIRPEAVRAFILSFGLSQADVEVPAENLYAANRRLLDDAVARYAFVEAPTPLRISGVQAPLSAHAPKHPDHPERGTRDSTLRPAAGAATALVAGADSAPWKTGQFVRLKDLVNVTVAGPGEAAFHSTDHANAKGAPIVQWVAPPGVPCRVVMVDGSVAEGVAEAALLAERAGACVQFERFGFARLESATPGGVTAVFAHK